MTATCHIEFEGAPESYAGYGVVMRSVMRDPSLSPEAKAIYAYLCSFTGDGSTAFPAVDLMLEELAMGKPRFYKHRKMLEDAGLLKVEKGRRAGSRYEHNVYRIPSPFVEDAKVGGSQNVTPQNDEFPQVNGESRFVTVQNVTANNGWLDGDVRENAFGSNPIHSQADPQVGTEARSFSKLCDSAVNRNRLGTASGIAQTRCAFDTLLHEGYSAQEIADAFDAAQASCRARGWEEGFFPQLLRWLQADAKPAIDRKRAKATKAKPYVDPVITVTLMERETEARLVAAEELKAHSPRYQSLTKEHREALDMAMACVRQGDPEGHQRWMARSRAINGELNAMVEEKLAAKAA